MLSPQNKVRGIGFTTGNTQHKRADFLPSQTETTSKPEKQNLITPFTKIQHTVHPTANT